MGVWIAAAWGLTGGLCVEALQLYARIHRTPKWNWRCPIDQGLAAFIISIVLRVGVGAVLAAAFAGSHQVSGPLAAFALGVGAPVVVERLAKAIPLTAGSNTGPQQHAAELALTSSVPSPTQDVLDPDKGGERTRLMAEDVTAGEGDG